MGNSTSAKQDIKQEIKQEIKQVKEVEQMNIPNICNEINYTEWISQIKQQQRRYQAKQSEEMKQADMSDYELFIEYLIFNRNIVGYSEISIISRIVRYYVGSVHGVSIFNENCFTFNGIRISIAIHPITGEIYIADEYQIYEFQERNNNNHQFKVIAKISNKNGNRMKITDLTFNSDGERLLCLMNSNLNSICYVIINNENICIEDRILYYTSYDNMDYLKYDFNHYYFDAAYLLSLLNFCDILNNDNTSSKTDSVHKNIRSYSTLYTLDIYRKQLWIICNSINNTNYDTQSHHELHSQNQPILIRIPFKFINITRKLQLLNIKMKNISHAAMDDIENDEYEDTLKTLQNEIDQLRLERIKDDNKCEIIDLYILLKLKELHLMANLKKRNEVPAAIYITAFDVDKLHGGIYIISSDKKFFRMEKIKRNYNNNNNNNDDGEKDNDECWFEKANKKFPNHFVYQQKKWCITHEALLHDVLPDGLPLGICNVRYDSITGRIIVADNYKIQALYI